MVVVVFFTARRMKHQTKLFHVKKLLNLVLHVRNYFPHGSERNGRKLIIDFCFCFFFSIKGKTFQLSIFLACISCQLAKMLNENFFECLSRVKLFSSFTAQNKTLASFQFYSLIRKWVCGGFHCSPNGCMQKWFELHRFFWLHKNKMNRKLFWFFLPL